MVNIQRKANLEDLFYFKRDREIIEKYSDMQKMEETKESLKKVSGIHDDNILQKLVDLNVRPETIASLALIPLIEIAWSDGNIELKEKDAILSSAIKFGWEKDGIDYTLIERWLEHKPSPILLETWTDYIESLCRKLSSEEIEHFKNEIIYYAEAVAKITGGIFGMGKVSKEEKELLEKLKSAFRVCSAESESSS